MDRPHQEQCPLCERHVAKARKMKTLYGVPVCPKCRNGFANRRQGAYLIDIMLWYGISMLVTFGVVFILPTNMNPAATGLTVDTVVLFILGWILLPLIFSCKDCFNGMSPGKMLTGIQVVDVNTREPIGFGRSLKRNLILVIPYVSIVGLIGSLITMMKGQRWGDGWANTMVILKKHKHKVPFDQRGLYCGSCSYNLTGNVSGRCPECGTPVTRQDPPVPPPTPEVF